MNVNGFADDLSVPSFGRRMVCTVCGAIGADARPNWNERALACPFGNYDPPGRMMSALLPRADICSAQANVR